MLKMKYLVEKAMTPQGYFRLIHDPRQQRKTEHKLIDIVVLSITAMICGVSEYKEIEIFGKFERALFKEMFRPIQWHFITR